MSDVVIPAETWGALKDDQRCFLPALSRIRGQRRLKNGEFSKLSAKLAEEGTEDASYLSPNAVTRLLSLQPLGIFKCEGAVRTLNKLAEQKKWSDRLSNDDIVVAVFWAPRFNDLLREAKMTTADFTTANDREAGHMERLAIAASEGKRLTFAAGVQLAQALAAALPDLHLRDMLATYLSDDRSLPKKGKLSLFDSLDLRSARSIGPDWVDWTEPSKLPSGIPHF